MAKNFHEVAKVMNLQKAHTAYRVAFTQQQQILHDLNTKDKKEILN